MRIALYSLLLIAMLGTLAYMNVYTLPLIKTDAQGLQPFDLRALGYSEADARTFLAALGPIGRQTYLGAQHTLDTIYPPLLAVVLIWTYLAVLSRPWALAGCAVAVAGTGADLVENARVAGLLTTGTPSAGLIAAASQATVFKSAMVTLALILLGVSLAITVIRWLRAP